MKSTSLTYVMCFCVDVESSPARRRTMDSDAIEERARHRSLAAQHVTTPVVGTHHGTLKVCSSK